MTNLRLICIRARAIRGRGHAQEVIPRLGSVIDKGNILGSERGASHTGPALFAPENPAIRNHFIRGGIREVVE